MTDTLEDAREAIARNDWRTAHRAYGAVRARHELGAEDVAAFAEAAWWVGAVDECFSASEEAYRLYLQGEGGDQRRAAMMAVELGYFWFLRGEMALGSGWFSRAHRLLADDVDCVEWGYLRSLSIDEAIERGELDEALSITREVLAIAEHHQDETLQALALVSSGIATIKQGQVTDGLRILDEAMLPVVSGRVTPSFAGTIYCQLMTMCWELADLHRAQQWTDATTKWCEGFTDAVMFLGVCRIHRAQLLTVHGQWADAEAEARRVCDDLARMNVIAVAMSFYEIGEVHRLRGEVDQAAAAYARAEELGRDPQPGRALLQAAQGRSREALEAIDTVLAAPHHDALARVPLCFAAVDIALAAGDAARARRAADELAGAAAQYGSAGLLAASAQATGAVRLAEGAFDDALVPLHDALTTWRQVDAPYRVAQVRVLLAQAHHGLGKGDAAQTELDEAAKAFARLGAGPDAARVRALRTREERPGGLTAREVEVLGLVATGLTNREVADTLVLSERTVARHLSNIFTKLGLSSRTAAASYAFEHDLAPRPRG